MIENIFFHKDVKIMTSKGFKTAYDLKENDKVMCIDFFGRLSLETPIIKRLNQSGEYYKIKTNFFTFTLSANQQIFQDNFSTVLSAYDIVNYYTGSKFIMPVTPKTNTKRGTVWSKGTIDNYALMTCYNRLYEDGHQIVKSENKPALEKLQKSLTKDGMYASIGSYSKTKSTLYWKRRNEGKGSRLLHFIKNCNTTDAKRFMETIKLIDGVKYKYDKKESLDILVAKSKTHIISAIALMAGYRVHFTSIRRLKRLNLGLNIYDATLMELQIQSTELRQNEDTDVQVLVQPHIKGIVVLMDSQIMFVHNTMPFTDNFNIL